jgi:hypothetical protein
MARFLLAWELGEGLGHTLPLGLIGAALRAGGHGPRIRAAHHGAQVRDDV